MTNIVLTIMMFATFVLLYGAWRMRSDPELRQKMLLMIATAVVIFMNIIIWTLPTDGGRTLADDEIEKSESLTE